MDIKNVASVYWGKANSGKRIASAISSVISDKVSILDISGSGVSAENVSGETVLVVVLPASDGRLSGAAKSRLEKFKGENSPAIAVVLCAGGGFGGALSELSELLASRGFCVVGAAAFVSDGKSRPDDSDFSRLVEFSSICSRKLESFCGCRENLSLPKSGGSGKPDGKKRFSDFFCNAFKKTVSAEKQERCESVWFA